MEFRELKTEDLEIDFMDCLMLLQSDELNNVQRMMFTYLLSENLSLKEEIDELRHKLAIS